MTPDPEVELAQLQEQVRATVRERQDIERQLANPDALRSATARAQRDRDAVTSPLLEEARGKIADDIADFLKEWRHMDKVGHTAQRLAPVIESAPDFRRRGRPRPTRTWSSTRPPSPHGQTGTGPDTPALPPRRSPSSYPEAKEHEVNSSGSTTPSTS
ncbi:hypothetical protein MycrhDRAFT_5708 [Mycolicibacterium rhodesiae JS60]|nr:hypothetical protein MycrhDRAFT_5708 [Mycolicibacterium rhodesiae JS60]